MFHCQKIVILWILELFNRFDNLVSMVHCTPTTATLNYFLKVSTPPRTTNNSIKNSNPSRVVLQMESQIHVKHPGYVHGSKAFHCISVYVFDVCIITMLHECSLDVTASKELYKR